MKGSKKNKNKIEELFEKASACGHGLFSNFIQELIQIVSNKMNLERKRKKTE